MRAKYPAPYPASKLPTLGPVWPNKALSDAIVKSHTTCRSCPPPIAYPFTIAMTGFGIVRIKRCKSNTFRRGIWSSPTYPPCPRTDWSPPEQNALSPSPVKTITPMDESSRASENASIISWTVNGVNALCTSGRLIDTFATPLYFLYLISLYSFGVLSHCTVMLNPLFQIVFLNKLLYYMRKVIRLLDMNSMSCIWNKIAFTMNKFVCHLVIYSYKFLIILAHI